MLESVAPVEVRRLAVTPACPVYFWSVETLVTRTFDDTHQVFLKDGVYLSTVHTVHRWKSALQASRNPEYLVVAGKTATPVTESAALLELGAFELLAKLELEDAAVSLMAGELLYARNQWVRWRYP